MEHPVVTQTRFPRLVRRVEPHHAPGQLEYVRIAVILAVLTALEVIVYYPGWPKVPKLVLFVALAATKFAIVAAFFMHLKFDGKLLAIVFSTGLALAGVAFMVAIVTIHAMN
ncbi:MAG TPA: cytochrome C oxidase subunit IV family protein [Dehalococcoidia bacterium]|nr:cytochrome C oxidase subunit IV family protein [Dehalococcoidia bacterium]